MLQIQSLVSHQFYECFCYIFCYKDMKEVYTEKVVCIYPTVYSFQLKLLNMWWIYWNLCCG